MRVPVLVGWFLGGHDEWVGACANYSLTTFDIEKRSSFASRSVEADNRLTSSGLDLNRVIWLSLPAEQSWRENLVLLLVSCVQTKRLCWPNQSLILI